MKSALVTLTAVSGLLIAGQSSADVIEYNFELSGDQEVPAVDTPGNGIAFVTIDTDTMELTWDVSYQDLLGNSTAAHFHGPADFGENAGVQVGMSGDFGNTSGTLMGSTTISASQMQDLIDGLWYINIHSTLHPGGEIRGQVVQQLPAPGALALIGLGAIAGVRRRRQAP